MLNSKYFLYLTTILALNSLVSCGGSSNTDSSFVEGDYFVSIVSVNASGVKSGFSNFVGKYFSEDMDPITISWIPPTQNTDGSPYTDPAGYIIYWGPVDNPTRYTFELNDPVAVSYILDISTF